MSDIDHAFSYLKIPYACKKCSFVSTGLMAATKFATHKCEDYKPRETKMDDQMEQVWRSKDGKVTGSREEVEAYLKSKNPLAKMNFPYSVLTNGVIQGRYGSTEWEKPERVALVAFANLAPKIEEVRKAWNENIPRWQTKSLNSWASHNAYVVHLLFAYEEALKQVPQ